MSEVIGPNPAEQLVSEQRLSDYQQQLENELVYLHAIDGNGFKLSETDKNQRARTESYLQESRRLAEHGYRYITLDTKPEDVTREHPELFAAAPEPMRSRPESEETIRSFTFETAKQKLDSLPFLDALPKGYTDAKEKVVLKATPESGYFEIPVDRIVYNGNYTDDRQTGRPSWAGRDGGYGGKNAEDGEGKGTEKSLDVIIRYAKKGKYDIQKGKPVHEVGVLYGSDGEVFYNLPLDNHRVSAAKLRGDSTIPVASIELRPKEVSMLTEQQTQQLERVTTQR